MVPSTKRTTIGPLLARRTAQELAEKRSLQDWITASARASSIDAPELLRVIVTGIAWAAPDRVKFATKSAIAKNRRMSNTVGLLRSRNPDSGVHHSALSWRGIRSGVKRNPVE